jgi:hypothetical protein
MDRSESDQLLVDGIKDLMTDLEAIPEFYAEVVACRVLLRFMGENID